MFTIFHGVGSPTDIRLAAESGFSAAGFYERPPLVTREQIARLMKTLPPFMLGMVTSVKRDANEIEKLVKETGAFVLCVTDKVSRNDLEILKRKLPYTRIVQLYSYSNIVSNSLYRARSYLCQADGVMVDFAGGSKALGESGSKYISELITQSTRPVFFAGIRRFENLERLLRRNSPYGVLVHHTMFTDRGITVREGMVSLRAAALGQIVSLINKSRNVEHDWDKWSKTKSGAASAKAGNGAGQDASDDGEGLIADEIAVSNAEVLEQIKAGDAGKANKAIKDKAKASKDEAALAASEVEDPASVLVSGPQSAAATTAAAATATAATEATEATEASEAADAGVAKADLAGEDGDKSKSATLAIEDIEMDKVFGAVR